MAAIIELKQCARCKENDQTALLIAQYIQLHRDQ